MAGFLNYSLLLPSTRRPHTEWLAKTCFRMEVVVGMSHRFKITRTNDIKYIPTYLITCPSTHKLMSHVDHRTLRWKYSFQLIAFGHRIKASTRAQKVRAHRRAVDSWTWSIKRPLERTSCSAEILLTNVGRVQSHTLKAHVERKQTNWILSYHAPRHQRRTFASSSCSSALFIGMESQNQVDRKLPRYLQTCKHLLENHQQCESFPNTRRGFSYQLG